jgi:hypothetical protein
MIQMDFNIYQNSVIAAFLPKSARSAALRVPLPL